MLFRKFGALGHIHSSFFQLLHGFEIGQQAAAVGNLDRESRPGIEFQQQGAPLPVENHVGPDIAQAGHLIAGGGQGEQCVPVGHFERMQVQPGIRMVASAGG